MVFEVVTFYNFLQEIQFSRSSPTITCNNKCQKWGLTFLFLKFHHPTSKTYDVFFFQKWFERFFLRLFFSHSMNVAENLFEMNGFVQKTSKNSSFRKLFLHKKTVFFFCSTFLTGRSHTEKLLILQYVLTNKHVFRSLFKWCYVEMSSVLRTLSWGRSWFLGAMFWGRSRFLGILFWGGVFF